MDRDYLFIAIEGVDGVGKTTVAKIIASKIDAIYVKTPINNFLKKIGFLVERIGNQEIEAIGYFILASISSIYFRFLLRKQNVICDKYILVTVVDQIVLGSKIARFFKRLYVLI